MPEARPESGLDARLLGIQFPRVKVEDRGLLIDLVDAVHAPIDDSRRQQTQVAAACDRQGQGFAWQGHVQRSQGKLTDCAIFALDVVREALGAGDAIVVVMDGEDARIVGKALLDEDVQGPQGPIGDGVARGAVAQHRNARDVLEDGL